MRPVRPPDFWRIDFFPSQPLTTRTPQHDLDRRRCSVRGEQGGIRRASIDPSSAAPRARAVPSTTDRVRAAGVVDCVRRGRAGTCRQCDPICRSCCRNHRPAGYRSTPPQSPAQDTGRAARPGRGCTLAEQYPGAPTRAWGASRAGGSAARCFAYQLSLGLGSGGGAAAAGPPMAPLGLEVATWRRAVHAGRAARIRRPLPARPA